MNKNKMTLLNNEEANDIKGGLAAGGCKKTGDIIASTPICLSSSTDITLKQCLTLEVRCDGGFTYDNGKTVCPSNFSTKKV